MRRLIISVVVAFLCLQAVAQNAGSGDFLDAAAEYAEGNYAEAYRLFSSLNESFPEDDAVNYYLGMCEFVLNKRDSSEAHLTKAVQLDSTNAWYLHALASLYNAKGDRVGFTRLGEKLLKMSPSLYRNPYTLTLIGAGKYMERSDSLSLEYFDQALEIDPDYAPAELGKLELLRSNQNFPPFFATLSHFIDNETAPSSVKGDYLTMIFENMTFQFYWVWGEQLGKIVDRNLELYSENPVSHLLKVRMLIIKSDYTAAYDECLKMAEVAHAVEDKENEIEAYYVAGDIAHQQGDMSRTYECYDKVLALNPDHVSVLNNYAYFLSLEKKSLRKALKMSKKTIDAEPDNATYLDTYGWILYLLKRPEEAKPYFKRAMIYGGKESAAVLEHYSKVLEALGDTQLSSYYKSLSEQASGK